MTTTWKARSAAIAVQAALGAAIVLVLTPLVAGASSGGAEVAVVDMRPGGGLVDDGRLAAQITDHADVDILLVVPPTFEDLAACGPESRVPRTCEALAGVRHTVLISGADSDGRGPITTGAQVTADFGYGAAVWTAVVISLLTAAAFFVALIRSRRRPSSPPRASALSARVPVTPLSLKRSVPLPDDVLAAIPPDVTAVTCFGAQGGFVDAGGVLVWAALTRPGVPVRPGRRLTVLSSSHERDSLLVTLCIPQRVRR